MLLFDLQLMFWYEAQNENGKTGMVPSNFLRPLDIGTPTSVSPCGHMTCLQFCVFPMIVPRVFVQLFFPTPDVYLVCNASSTGAHIHAFVSHKYYKSSGYSSFSDCSSSVWLCLCLCVLVVSELSSYQQGFPPTGSKGQPTTEEGYLQMNSQDVEQARKQGLVSEVVLDG